MCWIPSLAGVHRGKILTRSIIETKRFRNRRRLIVIFCDEPSIIAHVTQ